MVSTRDGMIGYLLLSVLGAIGALLLGNAVVSKVNELFGNISSILP